MNDGVLRGFLGVFWGSGGVAEVGLEKSRFEISEKFTSGMKPRRATLPTIFT